ncbi:MAG: lasso peptide biosynthesis B2 protein [Porphyrobacter sp.]|nr:lasso peptide biosynthesis B2 protein [Porphyrobacter sp.]
MSLPQSSPVPVVGTRPRIADTGWLVRYALRGLSELVRARIAFATLEARDVVERNRRVRERAADGAMASPAHVARIAYVLPRLSARLPWRSDCLVQAIAGQNWLAAQGIASEIRIGVQRSAESGFGAHAWLIHGSAIVSGGDIGSYTLLLGEETPDAAGVPLKAPPE